MSRINWSRHAVATFVERTLCITRSTFCATGSVSPTIGLLLGETGGEIPPPPPHQPTPSISAPHVILFLSLLLRRQKTLASYLRWYNQLQRVREGGGGGGCMKWGGGGGGGAEGTMYGLTPDSPTSVPRTCTQPVLTWLRFNQKTKQNTL